MSGPSRISLAHLPTPLEPAPRLSGRLKGIDVWIKRDDCTGLAFGGNKARKLEYLMASARTAEADTVVTFGGVQSNHVRSCAAAARRLGLDSHLLLAGAAPRSETGNLMLDRLLGAEVEFLELSLPELTAERVARAYDEAEERLRSRGRKPFRIAPGGSTGLGCLGYRAAFDEILDQARSAGIDVTHIITAYGTGGTLAGLILANILAGRPAIVTGISVAPPGMPGSLGVPTVESMIEEAAGHLGRRISIRPGDVRILYEHAGRAYGSPTAESIDAIRTLARTEGLFLDPVYTSKAMAGLLSLCQQGEVKAGESVIFLHTGGTPALFAYAEALA